MYYRDFKGIIKILQASLLFFYLFNAFQAKITSYVNSQQSFSFLCFKVFSIQGGLGLDLKARPVIGEWGT